MFSQPARRLVAPDRRRFTALSDEIITNRSHPGLQRAMAMALSRTGCLSPRDRDDLPSAARVLVSRGVGTPRCGLSACMIWLVPCSSTTSLQHRLRATPELLAHQPVDLEQRCVLRTLHEHNQFGLVRARHRTSSEPIEPPPVISAALPVSTPATARWSALYGLRPMRCVVNDPQHQDPQCAPVPPGAGRSALLPPDAPTGPQLRSRSDRRTRRRSTNRRRARQWSQSRRGGRWSVQAHGSGPHRFRGNQVQQDRPTRVRRRTRRSTPPMVRSPGMGPVSSPGHGTTTSSPQTTRRGRTAGSVPTAEHPLSAVVRGG